MLYPIRESFAHEAQLSASAASQKTRQRRIRALKGLRLDLRGKSLYFKSLDDFSFAIESRTSVPSNRFDDILDRSPSEFWHEADSIKSVEKNLVDILEDALIDSAACGPAIRDLGLQIFSKDHDWRPLMAALIDLDEDYEGYKRLALIKYMQYLGARQEILRLIFAMKNKGSAAHRQAVDGLYSNISANETVLFDLNVHDEGTPTEHSLQRLPRGEGVHVYALPGHAIEIHLAKHRFKLVNDDGWLLCDMRGHRHVLATGQNTVGRGSENDITLGTEFRDVSRRHLIAEPIDDHIILLTDISSHGTFAPPLQFELKESLNKA